MRSRRSSTEHAETVARRLELLGAEFRTAAPGSAASVGADRTAARGDVAVGADVGSGNPWAQGDEHTHLRPVPPLGPDGDPAPGRDPADGSAPAAEPEEEGPEAPMLPVPGRHADRGGRWLDLGAFRGRIGLGPGHVASIAVLVAVGLALTAWWVLRDDPGQLASPESTVPLVTPSDVGPGQAAASPATEVVVDVAGKVRRPGIVVLEPGARVVDALEAAGGPRRGVKLTGLNLARPLVDGEQIVVGVKPAPGVAASAAPVPGASAPAMVNLNTATLADLETLPGVGPVTAQAIIDWRSGNGGFRSVEQLLDVDGIGEKTLAELAPHVTLG